MRINTAIQHRLFRDSINRIARIALTQLALDKACHLLKFFVAAFLILLSSEEGNCKNEDHNSAPLCELLGARPWSHGLGWTGV